MQDAIRLELSFALEGVRAKVIQVLDARRDDIAKQIDAGIASALEPGSIERVIEHEIQEIASKEIRDRVVEAVRHALWSREARDALEARIISMLKSRSRERKR
jgi:hypothetical protein